MNVQKFSTLRVNCVLLYVSAVSGGPLQHKYTLHHFKMHWGEKDDVGSEHVIHHKPYSGEVTYDHTFQCLCSLLFKWISQLFLVLSLTAICTLPFISCSTSSWTCTKYCLHLCMLSHSLFHLNVVFSSVQLASCLKKMKKSAQIKDKTKKDKKTRSTFFDKTPELKLNRLLYYKSNCISKSTLFKTKGLRELCDMYS